MHYRCIAILACLISLQSNGVTEDSVVRRARTMTPLREIDTSYLCLLPTSAPATPQDAVDKFLKSTKSSCDFKTLVRKKAQYQAALEHIEKYMNTRMFIQQLMEEKRAEKQRLEEEKKEWLQYVRESNNSGYFPGYAGSDQFFCNKTNNCSCYDWESDPNFFGRAGRDHMDF